MSNYIYSFKQCVTCPAPMVFVTLCLMCFYGVVVIVCSLAFKRSVVFITCFPGALYMRDVASCLLFRLVWLTGTYCMQV